MIDPRHFKVNVTNNVDGSITVEVGILLRTQTKIPLSINKDWTEQTRKLEIERYASECATALMQHIYSGPTPVKQ